MCTNRNSFKGNKEPVNCDTAKQQPSKIGFRFIDHPSDVGMQINGETLVELFLNAAKGMLSIVSDRTGTNEGEQLVSKQLHIKEDSPEELLHSFLSEILWLIIDELFFPFRIRICTATSLSIEVILEGVLLKKEDLRTEVKAVTYHQLHICKRKGLYSTKLIFDV
jgi:SHS2 domain-containing protein